VKFEKLEKEIAQHENRREEIMVVTNGGETDFEKLAALGQELQKLKDDLEIKEHAGWSYLSLLISQISI
jgi:ABC transport system ATP-binding/permease protein